MWQLILGPILGLVGSGIEKFSEYKSDQLKSAEREKDRAHELAVMEKEVDLALKKTTVEGKIRQEVAAQATFDASYHFANDKLIPENAELSRGQLGWIVAVDVLSKSIRPLSTIWYQLMIAAIFGWSAWKLANASVEVFSLQEISSIYKEVVFSIIGLGETTLLWWYGIRRMSKKKDQT